MTLSSAERHVPGTIGVVGAGTMGAGIAQLALEAGQDVLLHDVDEAAIERGHDRIRDGLERRAAHLELDPDSIEAWVDGRLAGLRDARMLDAVTAEAQVVIEAVIEDLDLKRTIFTALDAGAPNDVILATNTSALSVAGIATATARPERVIGLHFFNPAPIMKLVEVVVPETTAEYTIERAVALVDRWGRTAVRCRDAPGFIVNRINRPFTLEALAMLEAGEASIEAIDTAIRGAGYPMGPFELMDFVGIDVNLAAAEAIHEAFAAAADPLAERFRPSAIQWRLVDEGMLGRKNGAGFYSYAAGRGEVRAEFASREDGSIEPEEILARIRLAIAAEAHRALDAELAAREDIDLAMRLGAAHPSGPFEWTATIGGRAVLAARLEERRGLGPRFAAV